MNTYFSIKSVYRNAQQTTLTLGRVEWWRETGKMVTDEIDGETYPDIEECDPTADGAYPDEIGGKSTELMLAADHPGEVHDFLTVTVVPTETSWTPDA